MDHSCKTNDYQLKMIEADQSGTCYSKIFWGFPVRRWK